MEAVAIGNAAGPLVVVRHCSHQFHLHHGYVVGQRKSSPPQNWRFFYFRLACSEQLHGAIALHVQFSAAAGWQ